MKRVEKEKRTVLLMIHHYCEYNHTKSTDGKLCEECNKLLLYSHHRLKNCSFGEKKTSCQRCKTHCYKPLMRRRIIEVMRFSGPRVIFHHPLRWFKQYF